MLSVSLEDVVPNPRRDAEALIVGFEMMRHVVAAEFHEIVTFEAEVVQGIVGHVVDHIPKQKTSKDAIDIIWQIK